MAYKILADTCVACGTCQGECPSGAIKEGDVYSIDPDVCIGCGACADACPTGAIIPEEEERETSRRKNKSATCHRARFSRVTV